MSMSALQKLYRAWEAWAKDAERSENGWQSDFPQWSELMDAAITAMTRHPLNPDELHNIEQAWRISEETEDLADYARGHIDECWEVLQYLARSASPDVRWQVYDVLGSDGTRAEALLRAALSDLDPYARRRAILALARLHPDDAPALAAPLLHDDDPAVRLAAGELAGSATGRNSP